MRVSRKVAALLHMRDENTLICCMHITVLFVIVQPLTLISGAMYKVNKIGPWGTPTLLKVRRCKTNLEQSDSIRQV